MQLMQVAPTSGNVSFSNPENDPLRTSFFLGMSFLNRTAMIVSLLNMNIPQTSTGWFLDALASLELKVSTST